MDFLDLSPAGMMKTALSEIPTHRDEADPLGYRLGDWIQTASGVCFFPLDPRREEIVITDIAHALSNVCRFTGHVSRFYSVAEHCCHVHDLIWNAYPDDLTLRACGLLHDASEAYICDMARPLKKLPEFEAYRNQERILQGHIMLRFGLPVDQPDVVTHFDHLMLGIEARDLMAPLSRPESWEWCTSLIGDCTFSVKTDTRPWSPTRANLEFMKRFMAFGRERREQDPMVK